MENNSPVSFGYKIGWFAIRSADRDAVVQSLALSDPTEATWKTGVITVYEDAYHPRGRHRMVFTSPPVDGWVFVIGDRTMGNGEEQGVREVEQLITRLSTEFGEAQAFATYRVVDYHHWMLARHGALVRSFAIVQGEVLADSGEPTPVELGFKWYPLRQVDGELDEEEPEPDVGSWPNEEAVMTVAGAWSINPQLLETFPPSPARGVLANAASAPRPGRGPDRVPGRRPWWRFR